jgi:hypothetical protein
LGAFAASDAVQVEPNMRWLKTLRPQWAVFQVGMFEQGKAIDCRRNQMAEEIADDDFSRPVPWEWRNSASVDRHP